MQTEINLPFITADASGPKHLNMTLTRAKLEQLTGDLIERSIEPVTQALEDANLKPSRHQRSGAGRRHDPHAGRAGGGASKLFGKEPHKGVNPTKWWPIGAAIQAGVLGGEVKDVLLLDVTPLTLSIETLGGVATAADRAQHHHPDAQEPDLLHRRRQADQVEIHVVQGERPMAADNKIAGQVHPRRHSAGAARHPADRGHLRHRRQRHPERHRQGQGHRPQPAHHHPAPPPACPRTRWSRWCARPRRTRRGPQAQGRGRSAQHGRQRHLHRRKEPCATPATRCRPTCGATSNSKVAALR